MSRAAVSRPSATPLASRPARQPWLGLALVISLVLGASPAPAYADTGLSQMLNYSAMAGLFVEAGKAEYSGGKQNPGMPVAVGFRYQERQGIITGTLTAIAIVVAGSMAAASPKSVESHREGNYIVTTTTYRSQAEQAALVAGTAAAAAGGGVVQEPDLRF